MFGQGGSFCHHQPKEPGDGCALNISSHVLIKIAETMENGDHT